MSPGHDIVANDAELVCILCGWSARVGDQIGLVRLGDGSLAIDLPPCRSVT